MLQKKYFPEILKISSLPVQIGMKLFALKTNQNKTRFFLNTPLIKFLSRMLKFQFEVVVPADKKIGELLPNNSWNGLFGVLQRGEADVLIYDMPVNFDRSVAFHTSTPYDFSPVVFLADNPQLSANPYAILHSFSLNVWLAIASSILLVLASSLLFEKRCETSSMMLSIYGALLNNMIPIRIRRIGTKILLLFWAVFAFFIAESFKAVLLSSLTFPIQIGIRNAKELAAASESDSFVCSTYKGYKLENYLQNSEFPDWRKIGRCVTRNNDSFTNDFVGFFNSNAERKAFIGSQNHLLPLRSYYFVSEDSLGFQMFVIFTRKSFCCREALDRALLSMASMGLLDKIQDDIMFFGLMFFKKLYPGLKHHKMSSIRKLSLQDFYGAFVVLMSGYVLSSVVLIIEIIFSIVKTKKSRRIN